MLSLKLDLPFIDTDTLIEEERGMSVQDIFEEFGEEDFRLTESSVISKLPPGDCIVSTGGGVILDHGNVRVLRENSLVFFLNITPEESVRRITGSERPPLTSLPLDHEVAVIMKDRMPAYLRSSDFCIDGGQSPEKVSDEIAGIVESGDLTTQGRELLKKFFKNSMMPSESERMLALDVVGERKAVNLCAISGNPCMHSKSPAIYRKIFENYGISGFYTYMEAGDFGEIIRTAKTSGMRGLSITIPFKEDAVDFMSEISPDAAAIGAVNTAVNFCGTFYGFNTDWIGIAEPLKSSFKSAGESMQGKSAVVVGAGGAARAAVYALIVLGFDVTVLNRNKKKAAELAESFECRSGGLNEIQSCVFDVIINATPVGMNRSGGSVVPESVLREGMRVFDLVYTPADTELLKMAEKKGCIPISGTEMFVHQAMEQFFLMFGFKPEEEFIREAML